MRDLILLFALLLSTAAAATPPGERRVAASGERGVAVSHFALELDSSPAGWLHSAEAGQTAAGAATEKQGADQTKDKQASNAEVAPITLVFGTGMSKAFYQWIQDALEGKLVPKAGVTIAADYDHRPISRTDFTNALISEVDLPALDAASKDAAKIAIKIKPEMARTKSETGPGKPLPFDPKPSKKWSPANFKLVIDDPTLKAACARVSKIEALVIKPKPSEKATGQLRNAQTAMPNLVFTVPEVDTVAFTKWHESAGKENDPASAGKNGSLQYLAPDMQEVLFTLRFTGLRIFSMTAEKSEPVHRVKVELGVDHISFENNGAAPN